MRLWGVGNRVHTNFQKPHVENEREPYNDAFTMNIEKNIIDAFTFIKNLHDMLQLS